MCYVVMHWIPVCLCMCGIVVARSAICDARHDSRVRSRACVFLLIDLAHECIYIEYARAISGEISIAAAAARRRRDGQMRPRGPPAALSLPLVAPLNLFRT